MSPARKRRTRVISIVLTEEVLMKLDEEVEKTGLSRSALIDQILRKYFKLGYVLRE